MNAAEHDLPGPGSPSPELRYLRLLHLADSAFPIGAFAHSFGLESLAAAGLLTTDNLEEFLRGHLEESGAREAVFCREAARLVREVRTEVFRARLRELNELSAALQPAREARAGNAALGLNFLRAALTLSESSVLRQTLEAIESWTRCEESGDEGAGIGHCTAFGLVGGALDFDGDSNVLAYLHQWVAASVSAFQRLLPLGQTRATRLLWNLKPMMIETARRSARMSLENVSSFTPLLDWGAMEHPWIATRLFIS